MTALELFKKAGLEDYLQSGAIGAGLGAAGMGAASYLGGAGKKDRGTSALKDALKGALLGGTVGAGYQGVKDLGSSILGHESPAQALKDQAAAAGKEIDPRPHSQAHPFQYAASKLTGSPFGAAGAAAGGAGMLGLEKLKRNVGKTLFNTAGADPKDFGNSYLAAQRGAGSLNAAKGNPLGKSLANMFGDSGSAKTKALEELLKSNPGLRNGSPAAHIATSNAAESLFPASSAGGGVNDKAWEALSQAEKNIAPGFKNGLLNKLKSYGRKGLIGAGIGGAAQFGADSLLNGWINSTNSPEQLELWNALSNK